MTTGPNWMEFQLNCREIIVGSTDSIKFQFIRFFCCHLTHFHPQARFHFFFFWDIHVQYIVVWGKQTALLTWRVNADDASETSSLRGLVLVTLPRHGDEPADGQEADGAHKRTNHDARVLQVREICARRIAC